MSRPAHAILVAGDDLGRPGTLAPGAGPARAAVEADLTARFGNLDIVPLPDGPTPGQIVDAFADVRRRTHAGELFVVMFAGHGDKPVDKSSGQRWYLTDGVIGQQWFDDGQLADALLSLDEGVDCVVISDCCYGAGFFERGARARAAPHRFARQQRLGTELAFGETMRLLEAQSTALFKALVKANGEVGRDSPMVCISAASKDNEVATTELPELARRTVLAADTEQTYSALKVEFETNPPGGAAFRVDARPDERLRKLVLGV